MLKAACCTGKAKVVTKNGSRFSGKANQQLRQFRFSHLFVALYTGKRSSENLSLLENYLHKNCQGCTLQHLLFDSEVTYIYVLFIYYEATRANICVNRE